MRFFNRTFLTEGLRQLAGEVVGRLTGQGDGDAVMQIQTPFGGGKTHTLITLYHLVKNAAQCFDHPALKDYWIERGWKKPPTVPVAAFDGNQVGVGAVEVAPGLSVQTMWGHVAWQLAGKAGYELMRSFDAERIAPGGDDIDKLLKLSGGGLIILDEVANYVETAAAVSVHDSTLAAQTRAYLQRLTTRAGQRPARHRGRDVASERRHPDPRNGLAPGAAGPPGALRARAEGPRTCAGRRRSTEIIRRRLFVPFGQDTEDKASRTKKANNRDATINAYVANLKARPQIPDSAKEHDYAERFKKSYPIHPSLFDILNLVGANPKLQRTRGVLRILALLVADLLKKNHNGGLIQASDIDLANEELRSELLELVDREFRSASRGRRHRPDGQRA